jgi:CrcB protein
MWVSYVAVAVGGAIGSVARLGVTRLCQTLFGAGFPWGTFAVNLVGCTAMGVLAGLLVERAADDPWRLFLLTGILGGFTTFSAFSLDAYSLWTRGEAAAAAGYVLGSVFLSLVGVVAGFVLSRPWVAA